MAASGFLDSVYGKRFYGVDAFPVEVHYRFFQIRTPLATAGTRVPYTQVVTISRQKRPLSRPPARALEHPPRSVDRP